ncbi:MAG TPA: DivIVA domain-containing protein [Longimicrobium sp.]|jgi:DivIVA domain-containing protein
MIDLTPLDVRKKKGDFRRVMRGYDAESVDNFLEVVASRMEELVRQNSALAGKVDAMSGSMAEYRDRERAMNEALVSAQQLREDMRDQARREADLLLREARSQGERIVSDAKRQVSLALEALRRIQGQRVRFLRIFRAMVERQLGEIEQEEGLTATLTRLEAEGQGGAERTDAGEGEGGDGES